ncbi:MAG: c-type cytochrome [Myxococcales bacterium]|nr:c-type cytochrome [Myxococcales bacterium]
MGHVDPQDAANGIVHEYDGIKEQDNKLPNWWLGTFYVTIAFAGYYWLAAEGFQTTLSPRAEFDQQMAVQAAEEAAKLKTMGAVDDTSLTNMAKNASAVAEGQGAFMANCASCHGANGGGGIGPNLTDNAWLHGGAPTKVYATIKEGFTAKGMPAWGAILGEEKTRLVSAYVVSLKNTNVAGGKPPAGEVEK